jgi:hypothetical protein
MAPQSRDVSFQTPLPGDPSAQRELAGIVEDALSALPGPWKVGVTAGGAQPGSLIITAYRDDGFECTVFVDGPLQRTFLYLRDQVANALQLHVLGIARPSSALTKPPN